MPVGTWIIFLWLSVEYLSIGWEILTRRTPFAPLGLLVTFTYSRILGTSRWTRVRIDAHGTLGHLLLCNLATMLSNSLWGSPTLAVSWGIVLLLVGSIYQLLENLTWALNGLTPFFQVWETLKPHVLAGGEVTASQRKRMKAEIKGFAPSHILSYLLGRIAITAIVITLAYTLIYHHVLSIDPKALADSAGNPVRSEDVVGLLAYSVNLTTHGDSDMKPIASTARLINSIHRVSNIFLFTLLISTIVTISQEDIKQRKEDLLKGLDDENTEGTI